MQVGAPQRMPPLAEGAGYESGCSSASVLLDAHRFRNVLMPFGAPLGGEKWRGNRCRFWIAVCSVMHLQMRRVVRQVAFMPSLRLAVVPRQRHNAVLEGESSVDAAGQHVAVVPHAIDVFGIIAGDTSVFNTPGNRCGNDVLVVFGRLGWFASFGHAYRVAVERHGTLAVKRVKQSSSGYDQTAREHDVKSSGIGRFHRRSRFTHAPHLINAS
jgi:hypothetical protein